ncbi:hypothetical protein CYMTET_3504, partial [Cymbomonas tetramitiformis]
GTHIKPNDLVTVRMPNATRATKTTSKLLGFTKTGPFLCYKVTQKSVYLKDIVSMEHTLVALKPDIDAAYEANERRLQVLKEDLANRPDAPELNKVREELA